MFFVYRYVPAIDRRADRSLRHSPQGDSRARYDAAKFALGVKIFILGLGQKVLIAIHWPCQSMLLQNPN